MRDPSRFYSYVYTFMQDFQGTADDSPWRPYIDIYERADAILVVVELPGIRPNDVRVSVEKGILTISGYRHKEIPSEAEHVHQMEIPHGPFKRSIKLQAAADVANIEADFRDGFLTITIPRKNAHE